MFRAPGVDVTPQVLTSAMLLLLIIRN